MKYQSFRRRAGAVAVLGLGVAVAAVSFAGPASASPHRSMGGPQRSMGGPARVQPVTVTVPTRGGPVRPDTVVYVVGRPVVIQYRPASPPPGTAAPLTR